MKLRDLFKRKKKTSRVVDLDGQEKLPQVAAIKQKDFLSIQRFPADLKPASELHMPEPVTNIPEIHIPKAIDLTPVLRDVNAGLDWCGVDYGVNDATTITMVMDDGWQHSVYIPKGEKRKELAKQLRILANLVENEGALNSTQTSSTVKNGLKPIVDETTAIDEAKAQSLTKKEPEFRIKNDQLYIKGDE